MEEGEYWPDYVRDRSLPEASLDYAELEAMMENGSLVNFTQGMFSTWLGWEYMYF